MRATSALVIACLFTLTLTTQARPYPLTPDSKILQTAQTSYLNLPLSFEVNQGQTSPEVQFLTHTTGRAVFLIRTGTRFVLAGDHAISDVRLNWVGANPQAHALGEDLLPGKVNYLRGNNPKRWQTGVATYRRVHYRSLYPKTDLIYYGNQQKLEYDLVLQPGANPSQIRMKYTGEKKISVAPNGDLLLHTAAGSLRQHRPVVYQRAGSRRQSVASRYVVRGNEVSIAVGNYDRRRELVIDPVMSFSTFLGGSNNDEGLAIAVDSGGHAFVAGTTISTDFPTTAGARDRTCGTDGMCGPASEPPVRDVFVTKLNASGTGLMYSTYLGGSDPDIAGGIAVDSAGNAYVAGETASQDFPGLFLGPRPGVSNVDAAFVSKLNPSGSTLVYSVQFGGTTPNGSGATAIAVDSAGQAYVTGATEATDFPTTSGAFQTGFAGPGSGSGGDAFVVKLNASGTAFLYSTYVGGAGRDEGRGIAINSSGNAFITGLTKSNNFPVTPGAFQTSYRGVDPDLSSSAFVTKLNTSGSALSYSTYLGGTFFDFANAIAVDKSTGNAYVTGDVQSKDFPVTSSAFQKTLHGARDAFVTKLSSGGSSLSYSTYLGGSADEEGTGIAVNSAGRASIVGSTSSSNFPTTRNAFQRLPGGSSPQDAFVTKLSSTGSTLTYSSFLGGSQEDRASAVGLDPSGNAYVTGLTSSGDYPTTLGAFDSSLGGGMDAFVAKVIEPSCSVPTTAPFIGICTPADGATVHAPVNIVAQTSDPTPVRLLQVYVDGVKKYQARLSAIAVKLPMTVGKHRVTVQEYNTSNAHFAKTIFITVSP